MTLAFRVDIAFVIGNHSWKLSDDTMMGIYLKRCDRPTDGRKEVFLELLDRSKK